MIPPTPTPAPQCWGFHRNCWVLGLPWVFSFALFWTGFHRVDQAGLNPDPSALALLVPRSRSTQLPLLESCLSFYTHFRCHRLETPSLVATDPHMTLSYSL